MSGNVRSQLRGDGGNDGGRGDHRDEDDLEVLRQLRVRQRVRLQATPVSLARISKGQGAQASISAKGRADRAWQGRFRRFARATSDRDRACSAVPDCGCQTTA
jgi:hypothetical protein